MPCAKDREGSCVMEIDAKQDGDMPYLRKQSQSTEGDDANRNRNSPDDCVLDSQICPDTLTRGSEMRKTSGLRRRTRWRGRWVLVVIKHGQPDCKLSKTSLAHTCESHHRSDSMRIRQVGQGRDGSK